MNFKNPEVSHNSLDDGVEVSPLSFTYHIINSSDPQSPTIQMQKLQKKDYIIWLNITKICDTEFTKPEEKISVMMFFIEIDIILNMFNMPIS